MTVLGPQLHRVMDGGLLMEDANPSLAIQDCDGCAEEIGYDESFWFWAFGTARVTFVKMHIACFMEFQQRAQVDYTKCEEIGNALV